MIKTTQKHNYKTTQGNKLGTGETPNEQTA